MKKFFKNNRLFIFSLLTIVSLRVYFELLIHWADRYIAFKGSPYWDVLELVQRPKWLLLWGNFDGAHYINIAENGYSFGLSQAFFPLYPQLIRWLNLNLIHNSILSGLLISTLSLIGFVYIFIKLGRLDYSLKTIRWAIIFLLLFPTSFFFFSIYTESFFLFLTALTFYLARRKKFILAAIIAGLASATRLVGIFLLPALLWEYYQVYKKPKLLPLVGLTILASSGLFGYLSYLQSRFQNFLIFVSTQPGFGAGRQVDTIVMIYQVIFRYLKMFITVSPQNDIYLVLVFEFLISLLFIGLIIFAYIKKFRLSYLIFFIPSFLLPTFTGSLASMPRYVLAGFPLFYLLANIKSKYFKISWLAISLLLLTWAFVRFSQGYWIS